MLSFILFIHVLSGFLALGFGLLAIISKKGRKTHVLTGRFFFYLMLSVAVTAVIVSLYKLNLFLLLVAGFAFYQNVSGYRSVKNKGMRPNWMDWSATLIGLVTGIVMISTLNSVLIVFGSISLFLVITDFRLYYAVFKGKQLSPLVWLSRHLGMMMGTYIATVTAFVLVNIRDVEPAWIPWLAPTVLGVPLMRYWDWKYTKSKQPKPITQKENH